MSKKKQMGRREGSTTTATTSFMDFEDQKMDIKSIMKDIEFLGSPHMTWKERKELENRKVIALGGKPPKKQRLPLSVARVTMKKQKEREQKIVQENLVLGRFGAKFGNDAKKVTGKRKPEDKVLKSTVGYFKNGVLDVKHLLQSAATRESGNNTSAVNKGRTKKGGKNNRGKKKGSGKKRH